MSWPHPEAVCDDSAWARSRFVRLAYLDLTSVRSRRGQPPSRRASHRHRFAIDEWERLFDPRRLK